MGFFRDLFSKSEYIEQIVRYEVLPPDPGNDLKGDCYFTLKFDAYYNGQRARCEYDVWVVPDEVPEEEEVTLGDYKPLFEALKLISPPEIKVRVKVRNEKIKDVLLDTDYLTEITGISVDLDYDGECLTD